MAQRINQKLAPCYYGPFQIEVKLRLVAFRLKLPATSKVHPIFHTFLLKRALATQTTNAEFTLEEVDLLLPHKVLAQRSVKQHDEIIKQVLIHWQHKPIEEATWEGVLVMKSRFPTFGLEDKTELGGKGE